MCFTQMLSSISIKNPSRYKCNHSHILHFFSYHCLAKIMCCAFQLSFLSSLMAHASIISILTRANENYIKQVYSMDKRNQKRICGALDKQYIKNWCPSLIQGLLNFFVASFVRYCPNKRCKIEIWHLSWTCNLTDLSVQIKQICVAGWKVHYYIYNIFDCKFSSSLRTQCLCQ